jgi:ferritin-like metal-binding protein YciE
MATTIDEQLTKYLTDAHSIEEQALAQLRVAPRMAGDPELAAIYQQHLVETEAQERRVRERLEAHGAHPSKVKDIVMQAGGIGFALFARLQPDTPGKLTAHSYSYEHLELASYELLARVAERAGDHETATVAGDIRDQERAMGLRLASSFERAVDASLKAKGAEDLREDVIHYLADAHAIEAQAVQLLERAIKAAGDPEIERGFRDHLEETHEQQRRVDDRLHELGGSPSKLKDAAMRLGALNWGMFFQSHPDTPGKLVAFAYAFEHLEIAGYELLARVARRAGDEETVALAESIGAQERAAADKLAATWDRAVEASLREQGVAVGAAG